MLLARQLPVLRFVGREPRMNLRRDPSRRARRTCSVCSAGRWAIDPVRQCSAPINNESSLERPHRELRLPYPAAAPMGGAAADEVRLGM
jgi:hypothetical protein